MLRLPLKFSPKEFFFRLVVIGLFRCRKITMTTTFRTYWIRFYLWLDNRAFITNSEKGQAIAGRIFQVTFSMGTGVYDGCRSWKATTTLLRHTNNVKLLRMAKHTSKIRQCLLSFLLKEFYKRKNLSKVQIQPAFWYFSPSIRRSRN